MGGLDSPFRVAVRFLERQADAEEGELVDAEQARGGEELLGATGDHVVLVDAVAGDAEAAEEGVAAIDRRAPREEDDAILASGRPGVVEVGAGVEGVVAEG